MKTFQLHGRTVKAARIGAVSRGPQHPCLLLAVDLVDPVTQEVDAAAGLRVFDVGLDWIRRHRPESGGWLVLLEGDYPTYLPAFSFADLCSESAR